MEENNQSGALTQRIFKACQEILEHEGLHQNIGKPMMNRLLTKMKPLIYIVVVMVFLLFASNGLILYRLHQVINNHVDISTAVSTAVSVPLDLMPTSS